VEIPHKDEPQGPSVGDDFEKALAEAEPEFDDGFADEKEAAPAKPEPEKQPEKEAEPEPGRDPEPEAAPEKKEAADVDQIMAGVNAVLDQLKKKNAELDDEETREDPPAAEVPAAIQVLLEHDDPAVQASGKAMLEQYNALNARLDRVEKVTQEEQVARVAVALDEFIEAVSKECDPPLTEKERLSVVDRLTDETRGPALARSLDFADGVNLVFPGRLKPELRKSDSTAAPKKGAEGSGPVVKVVDKQPGKPTVADRGGPAGRSNAGRPEPNTIREAVDSAFAELG
jgi:chemotaxis protein histidine kinase CheA